MRFFHTLIILLFTISATGQTIKGNITSDEGASLSNISVKLEGTTLGTSTDENGDFALRDVKPGTYTLVASGSGYAASKQNLVVISGKNDFLALELNKATQQYQRSLLVAVEIASGTNPVQLPPDCL
jgi:iron complex outermembrane receptor protein